MEMFFKYFYNKKTSYKWYIYSLEVILKENYFVININTFFFFKFHFLKISDSFLHFIKIVKECVYSVL